MKMRKFKAAGDGYFIFIMCNNMSIHQKTLMPPQFSPLLLPPNNTHTLTSITSIYSRERNVSKFLIFSLNLHPYPRPTSFSTLS